MFLVSATTQLRSSLETLVSTRIRVPESTHAAWAALAVRRGESRNLVVARALRLFCLSSDPALHAEPGRAPSAASAGNSSADRDTSPAKSETEGQALSETTHEQDRRSSQQE